MTQNDVVPGFDVLLDGARHSALHLETRDAYGVAEESSGFADWLATGRRNTDPDSEYWAFWTGLVRRTVARGCPCAGPGSSRSRCRTTRSTATLAPW